RLHVHSNTPDITQLYIPSSDGSVVEANSLSFTLAEGRSEVDVPLRSQGDWLRFDPVSHPGAVQVTLPHINTLLFNIDLGVEHFRPIEGVTELHTQQDGFTLTATTNDPTLAVTLPQQHITWARAASATLLAALFTLLLSCRPSV